MAVRDFKKGDTYHIIKGHVKPYKIHIVSIIKDNGNRLVVYKYFGRHKQWWHYCIEDEEILDFKIDLCKRRKLNGNGNDI